MTKSFEYRLRDTFQDQLKKGGLTDLLHIRDTAFKAALDEIETCEKALTEERAEVERLCLAIGGLRMEIEDQQKEIERLRSASDWQPAETAPENEVCNFWLDLADDYAKIRPPLPWRYVERFYQGRKGSWSSQHKALFWCPVNIPSIPSPPPSDTEKLAQQGLAALRTMITMIGHEDYTDRDIARLMIDNEEAIRQIANFCDPRDIVKRIDNTKE